MKAKLPNKGDCLSPSWLATQLTLQLRGRTHVHLDPSFRVAVPSHLCTFYRFSEDRQIHIVIVGVDLLGKQSPAFACWLTRMLSCPSTFHHGMQQHRGPCQTPAPRSCLLSLQSPETKALLFNINDPVSGSLW